MKRRVLAVLIALLLMSVPVLGSQGGPKPKPPKPTHVSVSKPVKATTTTKVKPVSVKAPKPAKATAVKPVKSTTKATKPVKSTTTKSAKADVKNSKKSTTTTTSTTATEPSATTTTTNGETVPLTKVQEKLKRNTNLAAKLEGRLPDGTDLMKAADGFKNLGQFVAAVNVSKNHGFTFTELKALMVKEGYSLGQAIQKLKASSDGTAIAQRAEYDADRMIVDSEREVSAPTGVSATPSSTTTTASSTSTTTTTSKSKAKAKSSKKVTGAQQ